ncbi:MAG: transposase [Pseudomonadales bacterium]
MIDDWRDGILRAPVPPVSVGLRRESGASTGVINFIQRHGSAANLNVHLHMLVLDGLFAPFYGVPKLTVPTIGRLATAGFHQGCTRTGMLV